MGMTLKELLTKGEGTISAKEAKALRRRLAVCKYKFSCLPLYIKALQNQ